MPRGSYTRVKYKPMSERFWRYVQKTDGCWIWTGGKSQFGHGVVYNGSFRPDLQLKKLMAHRASYEIAFGPIPDGLCVLHKCDVPACVNPNHLFLGTKDDNMKDMTAKGRRKDPSTKINAKLAPGDVLEIRTAHGSQKEIAEKYGISQPMVCAIKRRERWGNL